MVSIIVPVYNVEDYILKCLQSVSLQSYSGDIECLIIDDCGSDNSIQLAEHFVASYKGGINFRIIHHDCNKGLSAARNTGIRESKGEWLFFLDSDDWIIPECINLMMEQVKCFPRVDMIMGDISTIGAEYNWTFADPGVYKEGFIEMACSYKIYTMAWNKLLSKDFILSHNLFFEEGLVHEDVLWFFQCACCMKMMVSLGHKTYNYLVRSNSLQTIESFDIHFVNLAKVRMKMIEYVFANGLSSNLDIFHFIYDDIYNFVFDALSHKRKDLVSFFLDKLRHTPFWRLNFLMANGKSMRNVLFSLFRYLPPCTEVGYFVLIEKITQLMSKLKRERKILSYILIF